MLAISRIIIILCATNSVQAIPLHLILLYQYSYMFSELIYYVPKLEDIVNVKNNNNKNRRLTKWDEEEENIESGLLPVILWTS